MCCLGVLFCNIHHVLGSFFCFHIESYYLRLSTVSTVSLFIVDISIPPPGFIVEGWTTLCFPTDSFSTLKTLLRNSQDSSTIESWFFTVLFIYNTLQLLLYCLLFYCVMKFQVLIRGAYTLGLIGWGFRFIVATTILCWVIHSSLAITLTSLTILRLRLLTSICDVPSDLEYMKIMPANMEKVVVSLPANHRF